MILIFASQSPKVYNSWTRQLLDFYSPWIELGIFLSKRFCVFFLSWIRNCVSLCWNIVRSNGRSTTGMLGQVVVELLHNYDWHPPHDLSRLWTRRRDIPRSVACVYRCVARSRQPWITIPWISRRHGRSTPRFRWRPQHSVMWILRWSRYD